MQTNIIAKVVGLKYGYDHSAHGCGWLVAGQEKSCGGVSHIILRYNSFMASIEHSTSNE